MPNTLAHIGTQGLISSGLFRKIDLKWVLLGCILPDIPWIIRRTVLASGMPVSLYDLQLYAIGQSSLFGTIFLAIAVSTFSKNFKRVFFILSFNIILHLLLDSLQVKWGSGVHLLAPFDWKMLSFDLFWPESIPSILMTAAGVFFIAYACIKFPVTPGDLVLPKGKYSVVFAVSIIAYFSLPIALKSMPERADNQFLKTHRQVELRRDRPIEFERRPFYHKDGKCVIKTIANEELAVYGMEKNCSGVYSAQAVFLNERDMQVIRFHRHWDVYRSTLSYVGLFFIGIYWFRSIKLHRF